MGKIFHKLFYHAIWSTAFREPSIDPAWESDLQAILKEKAARLGCYVYACDGTEDHRHIVLSIPPAKSISVVIGEIKGASAFMVNHRVCNGTRPLTWQDGFGVLTVAERDLPHLIRYVEHQKEHHKAKTTIKEWEKTQEDLL